MSLHLFVSYCFTQPLSDYTPVYCLVLRATTHTASYDGGRAEPPESFDPVEDAEGQLQYLYLKMGAVAGMQCFSHYATTW